MLWSKYFGVLYRYTAEVGRICTSQKQTSRTSSIISLTSIKLVDERGDAMSVGIELCYCHKCRNKLLARLLKTNNICLLLSLSNIQSILMCQTSLKDKERHGRASPGDCHGLPQQSSRASVGSQTKTVPCCRCSVESEKSVGSPSAALLLIKCAVCSVYDVRIARSRTFVYHIHHRSNSTDALFVGAMLFMSARQQRPLLVNTRSMMCVCVCMWCMG